MPLMWRKIPLSIGHALTATLRYYDASQFAVAVAIKMPQIHAEFLYQSCFVFSGGQKFDSVWGKCITFKQVTHYLTRFN